MASEGSTLTLKPRVDVTRSPKQGYQWPHEKEKKRTPPVGFFSHPKKYQQNVNE